MAQTWQPLPKHHNRHSRAVWTGAQVSAYFTGAITLPTALVDALGRPDRVHLFSDGAGELWICPAADDDQSAYRIGPTKREGPTNRRQLTTAGLYDRLGFTDEVDPIRGDWTVEDDRVIVRFSVDGGGP